MKEGLNYFLGNINDNEEKVMDIVTVIKVVGTILTVVASSIEATTKK